MSFPPSTEAHKASVSNAYESAAATVQADTHDSKHAAAAAEATHDGAVLPPQTPSAKFAFDETLFGSTPLVSDTAIDYDDQDDATPYPDAQEGSLIPPPDFKPFFTLIEDSLTGEPYHPAVHYVFADDDQDILTAAALETISDEQQSSESERFMIVDLSADGKEVLSVSSLSPDWQGLKTKVTQAPSWGDESGTSDRGLMLRIFGRETENWSDHRRKSDVDGLLKAFDNLTSSLVGVLESTTAITDTQAAQ